MPDLTEFLQARLDERERLALMAAGPIGDHWQADGGQVVAEHPTDAIVNYAGQAADHIAFHDPAWVLADVEAKRRIVARHYRTGPDDVRPGACEGCGFTGDLDTPNTDADEVCPELADLALPYAGHEDYRDEWHAPG